MSTSLYKKIATISLSGLLSIAAISTGCSGLLIDVDRFSDSAQQVYSEMSDETGEQKLCTCSLKKQITDFVAHRISNWTDVLQVFDTDVENEFSANLSLTSVDFSSLTAPPPQEEQSFPSDSTYTDWPVALARAHL